jgi:hypothetical protein
LGLHGAKLQLFKATINFPRILQTSGEFMKKNHTLKVEDIVINKSSAFLYAQRNTFDTKSD